MRAQHRILDPVDVVRRPGLEVVGVDHAAGHAQQLLDGDPVAVGQEPRQPVRDRVIELHPPLADELEHERRGPRLAHAVEPQARFRRHRRADPRDPRRAVPHTTGTDDVGGHAGRDPPRPRHEPVDDPLEIRPRALVVAIGRTAGDEHRQTAEKDDHGQPQPHKPPAPVDRVPMTSVSRTCRQLPRPPGDRLSPCARGSTGSSYESDCAIPLLRARQARARDDRPHALGSRGASAQAPSALDRCRNNRSPGLDVPRASFGLRGASESRTAHAKQHLGLGEADADVTLGRSRARPAPLYLLTRYSISVAHSS